MADWAMRLLVLAADAAPTDGAGGAADQASGNSFVQLLFFPIVIGVLFYFLLFLPQKRERKKQDELLKGLKKNDRVVTVGGVVGTIVNIEPDSKVVTLRVDDNTRMQFLRTAIQGPYSDAKEEPATKESTN